MNESLKTAVLEQLSIDTDNITEEDTGMLEDIANNEADAVWVGFTYYSDTVTFYADNKSDIIDLASEYAEMFGSTMSEMIAGFGCVNETAAEVEQCLIEGEGDENYTSIANALAWFALEEVARAVSEA